MDIKSLSQDVRKYLRSGININSVAQCVMELVITVTIPPLVLFLAAMFVSELSSSHDDMYHVIAFAENAAGIAETLSVRRCVLNSLDAKSTSIAVRINLQTFRIQIVDNGMGITKSNMNLVGIRYMTSKCQSIEDLKRIKTFGFRGESLASIRKMSRKMIITSRPVDIENTYSKTYTDGKWDNINSVNQRPSRGTTITIENFMYNMPVRQKRVNQNLDLHEIRRNLECLAIIHPCVSFNIRNDINGKIVFRCNKSQTVAQTLTNIYPDIDMKNLMDFKITKGKIRISGFIYKGKLNYSRIQFIYLNKRPIVSQKIQTLINNLLFKSLIFKNGEKLQYPAYIINISCPYSEIDLTCSPSKKTIEFKQWNVITKCVEKATRKLLEQEGLIDISLDVLSQTEPDIVSIHSKYGLSQMKDAVKGLPVKRKNVKSDEINDNKYFKNSTEKNRKRKHWNIDKHLLPGKEKEIRTEEEEIKNNSNYNIQSKVIVTTALIHNENDVQSCSIDKVDICSNVQSSNEKDISQDYMKQNSNAIVKPIIKRVETSTDLVDNIDRDDSVLHNKQHINTQSLLFNSDINTTKPYSWLNSNIETNILNNQEKGKNLIMDMFLKSAVAYPNNIPDSNGKDAISTITIANTKKQKFISNPNTTTMTMSVKYMSKTIVTNSYKPNKQQQNDNNKTTQSQETDHEKNLKVSKCVQTTMIEHQKEFQLNFNCLQPSKQVFHFQDNPASSNNNYCNGFFNSGNKFGNNFRKPIKKYCSDYNFNFSNFNTFNEPYEQFIKQRDFQHHNNYVPFNNAKHYINHEENLFDDNQRNNWIDCIPDDFTIPLYQSYNPYKENNYNLLERLPFQWKPVDLNTFPRCNYQQDLDNNYTVNPKFNLYFEKPIPPEHQMGHHQVYHKIPLEEKRPNYWFTTSPENKIVSPYFKKPHPHRSNVCHCPKITHRNLQNKCKFYNLQNNNKCFHKNVPTSNVHCVSPYFQNIPSNRIYFDERSHKNNITKSHKLRSVMNRKPLQNIFPRQSFQRYEQFNNKPIINEGCKEVYANKHSFGFKDNFLCYKKPIKRHLHHNNAQKDKEFVIIEPQNGYYGNTRILHEKFNTEPLYSKNQQDKTLETSFRKMKSDPCQFFFFDAYNNEDKDIECSFPTPNINKSTTADYETGIGVEEINLSHSPSLSSEEIDSSLCFDKFNPKLSSTQYFDNNIDLNVSVESTKKDKLDSDVVDETPNKNLDNLFVPSLVLPPQKYVVSDDFKQSGHKIQKNNKENSLLEITVDTRKFKTHQDSIFNECNKKFSTDEGQKMNLMSNANNDLSFFQEGNVENEWIKKVDSCSNAFYVHKRTGMTSLHSPRQCSNFNFVKRLEFIPKGLSPVLIEPKQVDKSLSPTSKKSLYATIMESYENELNTIKWSNYIHDYKGANRFFEELYAEKAKQFEKAIPNANMNNLPRSMIKLYSKTHCQSFTKDVFNDLAVIGQLDQKFITAMSKKMRLIILFDQHAVHERIRLENLLKDYTEAEHDAEKLKFKSKEYPKNIIINLMEIDINILVNSRKLFEDLGLSYKISGKKIEVTHIPTCMYNKFIKNEQNDKSDLENMLTSLIYEEISMILSTRGTISKIPNILQNIINLEACRGAIKFGDRLTSSECDKLLKQLSKCKLPYQCAHGRPTMIPIIDLDINTSKKTKLNLRSLQIS